MRTCMYIYMLYTHIIHIHEYTSPCIIYMYIISLYLYDSLVAFFPGCPAPADASPFLQDEPHGQKVLLGY